MHLMIFLMHHLAESVYICQKTCCWHRCGTMLRERKMILSKQHFSSLLLIHTWNFNLKNYHTDYFSSSYMLHTYLCILQRSLYNCMNGSHCWSFHLEVYYLSVYTMTDSSYWVGSRHIEAFEDTEEEDFLFFNGFLDIVVFCINYVLKPYSYYFFIIIWFSVYMNLYFTVAYLHYTPFVSI